MGFIEQISNASGIAIHIDSKVATEIRVNEYNSPGNNCPVCISPIKAARTLSGDGTNNGVVIIEPICQMNISITIPRIFFILYLFFVNWNINRFFKSSAALFIQLAATGTAL